jgi:hypothetical protein
LPVLFALRVPAYTLSLVFYGAKSAAIAAQKRETFHEFARHLACCFVALSPHTS